MLTSLILALGVPLAYACGFNNLYLDWQCAVCGPEVFVQDGPLPCIPVNATFDNIEPGPITNVYSYADWEGFDVVQHNTTFDLLPQINPYSKPNYAKVAAGSQGSLTLRTNGGTNGNTYSGYLYSLEYACALPGFGIPFGCTVTIEGYCQRNASSYPPVNVQETLQHNPSSIFDTKMNYTRSTLPQEYSYSPFGPGGACLNYTISAVSSIGSPVDLYLDNVIYAVLIREGV